MISNPTAEGPQHNKRPILLSRHRRCRDKEKDPEGADCNCLERFRLEKCRCSNNLRAGNFLGIFLCVGTEYKLYWRFFFLELFSPYLYFLIYWKLLAYLLQDVIRIRRKRSARTWIAHSANALQLIAQANILARPTARDSTHAPAGVMARFLKAANNYVHIWIRNVIAIGNNLQQNFRCLSKAFRTRPHATACMGSSAAQNGL